MVYLRAVVAGTRVYPKGQTSNLKCCNNFTSVSLSIFSLGHQQGMGGSAPCRGGMRGSSSYSSSDIQPVPLQAVPWEEQWWVNGNGKWVENQNLTHCQLVFQTYIWMSKRVESICNDCYQHDPYTPLKGRHNFQKFPTPRKNIEFSRQLATVKGKNPKMPNFQGGSFLGVFQVGQRLTNKRECGVWNIFLVSLVDALLNVGRSNQPGPL